MSEETPTPKVLYQKEHDNLYKLLHQIPDVQTSNRFAEFRDSLSVEEEVALSKLIGIYDLCEKLKGDSGLARRGPGTLLEEALNKIGQANRLIQKLMSQLESDKTASLDRASQWLKSQRAAIDTQYGEIFGTVGQLINWGKITAEREIGEYLGVRKKELDEIGKLKETADALVSEIEAKHKRSEEYLRGKGIAAHADMVKDEAQCHHWRALEWGAATLVLCVGFVSLVWIYRGDLVPASSTDNAALDMTTAVALQMAVVKLALSSVFLFMIFFCGRACQSHMHNATVNRHRYNALRTFELFKERGVVEGATYDTLLLYVAQAIFAPQRTGFIGKDPAVSAMSPAIRIVRDLAEGGTTA